MGQRPAAGDAFCIGYIGDNHRRSVLRWQPTCQARDSGVSGAPPSAAWLTEQSLEAACRCACRRCSHSPQCQSRRIAPPRHLAVCTCTHQLLASARSALSKSTITCPTVIRPLCVLVTRPAHGGIRHAAEQIPSLARHAGRHLLGALLPCDRMRQPPQAASGRERSNSGAGCGMQQAG